MHMINRLLPFLKMSNMMKKSDLTDTGKWNCPRKLDLDQDMSIHRTVVKSCLDAEESKNARQMQMITNLDQYNHTNRKTKKTRFLLCSKYTRILSKQEKTPNGDTSMHLSIPF